MIGLVDGNNFFVSCNRMVMISLSFSGNSLKRMQPSGRGPGREAWPVICGRVAHFDIALQGVPCATVKGFGTLV